MASVGALGQDSAAPPAGRLTLPIDGMTCASCVGRVERALKADPGVAEASVNLATGRAEVAFAGEPDPQAAIAAVESAGYAVGEATTELGVAGMTCASCVGRVEKALKRVPGVLGASVNLATERAEVRHLAGVVSPADLEAAVRRAGYEARRLTAEIAPGDHEVERRERETRSLRLSLLVAAVLTLPVVALEMGSHLIPGMHDWTMAVLGHSGGRYVQFALTTLVLFGPGLRFYAKGVPALLRGAPDMNSLVAVGTAAAYGYSVAATFASGILPAGTANVYYEAAAVIVTLILLGRALKARAKGRTSEAIRRLMGLAPKTARVVRDGGAVEIPLDRVRAGDFVLVRPGEKVPVDGEVIEGS